MVNSPTSHFQALAAALTMPADVPEMVKPWGHIVTGYLLDGAAGIRRAVHKRDSDELRQVAAGIAHHARMMPHLLEALGLPHLDGAGFWVAEVLPDIRKELERRSRPRRVWASNSPIARLKSLDIIQVAERFTELRPAGPGKWRGRCPLHQEKTPSFYVYDDRQRWHCFGGCATGGDVVDLLERLSGQGVLG